MAIKEFITLEGVDQVEAALGRVNTAGEESLKQFRDLGGQGGGAFDRLVQDAKGAGLQMDETTEKTTKLSQAFKIVKPLAQLFGVELGNIGSFAKIASNSLIAFGATAVGGIIVALGNLEENAARIRGTLADAFKTTGAGDKAFDALTQSAKQFGTSVGGLEPALIAFQTALSNVDRTAKGFVALRAEDLPFGLAPPTIKATTDALENFIKILRAGRLTQDDAQKSAAAFFNAIKEGGVVTKAALQALPIGTIELLKQALGAAGISNAQFFAAVEAGAISIDKLTQALAGFGPQAQKAFDTKAIKTMGDELNRILTELNQGFGELTGKPFSDFIISQLEGVRKGIRATIDEFNRLKDLTEKGEEAIGATAGSSLLGKIVQGLRNLSGVAADVVPLPRPRPAEADETRAILFKTDALDKNTKALHDNLAAIRANIAAERDAIASKQGAIQAQIDQGLDIEEGIKRLNAFHDALIDLRRKQDEQEKAARAAADKKEEEEAGAESLKNIFKTVPAEAEASGAASATAFGKGWVSAPIKEQISQPVLDAAKEAGTQAGTSAGTSFGEGFKASSIFGPQGFLPNLEELKSAFTGGGKDAAVNFSQAFQQTPPDFSGLTTGLQIASDTAKQMAQALYDSIKAIFAQPIAVTFSKGGAVGSGFGGEAEGAPFASGGRVIGPGSWTSDSILARLSRDEFVQPAMRVHQYGMDFMEAIRRGLLSTDAVRALMGDFRGLRFGGSAFPRFAEGGAVTSGTSRTLNLILGGQSFPVTGSAKVIDSLEREAALRSMASTGIAQSFVGRR